MAFRSFLGYNEKADIRLEVEDRVPEITMDVDFVLGKALDNGTFRASQHISQLESERSVAQAKANRGLSLSVSTQFGLSNNADKLPASYSALLDREVFGISLRVPILDWGLGKGRVKMAQARQEVTLNQLEQAMTDFEQGVYQDVMQFNAQRSKLLGAERASVIATQRYELAMKDFTDEKISVTDLNTAQVEKDQANMSYVSEIQNFWVYYFSIRKMTLYDFMSKTDISTEYDKLID